MIIWQAYNEFGLECYKRTQTQCLPCKRGSEDVEEICEDNKLLHLESSVCVRPVVHAGVVVHLGINKSETSSMINSFLLSSPTDLVWLGALPVSEEHSVQMSPLVLKGVETLQHRGLGDHVLALGGEHRGPHGGGEEHSPRVTATRALHLVTSI